MTLSFFISHAVNNLSVCVAMWFYTAFLPCKKKYEQKKLLAGFIMYFGILITDLLRNLDALNTPFWFIALTVIYFVFQFSVMCVVFDASLWQKLLIFFAHKVIEAFVISASDKFVGTLAPIMLTEYENGTLDNLPVGILFFAFSIFSDFLACGLIIWIYRLIKKKEQLLSEKMLFILIPVSQLFLFAEASYVAARYDVLFRIESTFLVVGCALAVVGDIALFITLNNIKKKALLEKQMELIEAQQEGNISQLKSIEAVTKRQQMLNHDLRNQLITAGLLLEGGDALRAKQSIQALTQLMTEYEDKKLCANPTVNAVANYKLAAKDAGVELDLELRVPEELPISDIDLCSIFTNILDNAIRALGVYPKEKERRAALNCGVSHGLLLIHESNPYDDDALKADSEDGDRALHGFGLDILRFIAEKYDGTLEVDRKDGVFDLKMSLPV